MFMYSKWKIPKEGSVLKNLYLMHTFIAHRHKHTLFEPTFWVSSTIPNCAPGQRGFSSSIYRFNMSYRGKFPAQLSKNSPGKSSRLLVRRKIVCLWVAAVSTICFNGFLFRRDGKDVEAPVKYDDTHGWWWRKRKIILQHFSDTNLFWYFYTWVK